MYRKITSFLQAWKENEHRKPLILQGARQVGKTYSVLEFGRTHYENVAYFNFETNPKLNETFEENISPDYLIPILSHIAGQTIVREKTLIVFDEVQLCERALTSLKYFCEDAPLRIEMRLPCRTGSPLLLVDMPTEKKLGSRIRLKITSSKMAIRGIKS